MLDLNVLSKAITEESSLTVNLNKQAGKLSVTIIPVLKPLENDSDPVVTALYAILAQPVCITAPDEGDINAFVNAQMQSILEARQPAQSHLSSYQAQVAEAINQARLAEQEAKDKKAKQEAEKSAKKAAKAAPAAAVQAPVADVDTDAETDADADVDNENEFEGEQAQTADKTPPTASVPFSDLFSDLGVSA